MKTLPILPSVLLAILASACSTTHLSLAPLEGPTEVPLTWRAGWEQTPTHAEAGELDTSVDFSSFTAVNTTDVNVVVVRLGLSESEALLGEIGSRPAAFQVAPAEIERMLRAISAQDGGRITDLGSIGVAPDRAGRVAITGQKAYIAAFEVSQTPGHAIGDPIVQVAEHGITVHLAPRASTEKGALDLDVNLTLKNLELPMRERKLTLFGSAEPVTVQEPAALIQRIQVNASLSGERALLIAGIQTLEKGETHLIVLRRN